MSNHLPNGNNRPWWALSGIYARLPGHLAPEGSLASTNSGQASPAVSTQSDPSTDTSWNDRILRGQGETLDDYIARLEAECKHHPRPARKAGQTKEEYAGDLWLRVYNKYCKRKSRANGNMNGKRRSTNASSRSQTANSTSTQADPGHSSSFPALTENSLLLQSFQPSSTGVGNGTILADLPSQETRATAPSAASFLLHPNTPQHQTTQGQEAGSDTLRAQQSIAIAQNYPSRLEPPMGGLASNTSTTQCHGNVARTSNLRNLHSGGFTLTVRLSDLEIIPGGLNIDAQAALEFQAFAAAPNLSLEKEEHRSDAFEDEEWLGINDDED